MIRVNADTLETVQLLDKSGDKLTTAIDVLYASLLMYYFLFYFMSLYQFVSYSVLTGIMSSVLNVQAV